MASNAARIHALGVYLLAVCMYRKRHSKRTSNHTSMAMVPLKALHRSKVRAVDTLQVALIRDWLGGDGLDKAPRHTTLLNELVVSTDRVLNSSYTIR